MSWEDIMQRVLSSARGVSPHTTSAYGATNRPPRFHEPASRRRYQLRRRTQWAKGNQSPASGFARTGGRRGGKRWGGYGWENRHQGCERLSSRNPAYPYAVCRGRRSGCRRPVDRHDGQHRDAALAYTRPRGNRFNPPAWGVWYCAFDCETSLQEVAFHPGAGRRPAATSITRPDISNCSQTSRRTLSRLSSPGHLDQLSGRSGTG